MYEFVCIYVYFIPSMYSINCRILALNSEL